MKVLNYHKDNTLLQNSIRCFPVIDNCGPDSSPQVSHIAAVLVETKGEHHSESRKIRLRIDISDWQALTYVTYLQLHYLRNSFLYRIHPVRGGHGPHGGLALEGSRYADRPTGGLSHVPTL